MQDGLSRHSPESAAKEQAFRPQPRPAADPPLAEIGLYLEGAVREFGKLGLAEPARFYVCGLQSRSFAVCFHVNQGEATFHGQSRASVLRRFSTCQPERSERSHAFEKVRFFAEFILRLAEGLRMTIKVKRFMARYTSMTQLEDCYGT